MILKFHSLEDILKDKTPFPIIIGCMNNMHSIEKMAKYPFMTANDVAFFYGSPKTQPVIPYKAKDPVIQNKFQDETHRKKLDSLDLREFIQSIGLTLFAL